MAIQFNSRLRFSNINFNALSWNHLITFFSNPKLTDESVHDAWRSVLLAWKTKALERWLEYHNNDIYKILKEISSPTGDELTFDEQKTLAKILFKDRIPDKIQTILDNARNTIYDTNLIEGKNWIVTLNTINRNSKSVRLSMIWVAPGSFYMGSDEKESFPDEHPIHKVNIRKGFWIGKYQLTQEQWTAIGGKKQQNNYFNKGGLFPVECITWSEAKSFCQKLNEKYKEKIGSYYFDLPTEAQWEFAARRGKEINTIQNYKYSGDDDLDKVGWFQKNSDEETHEVGRKRPNALGIYDMSGNVWEWCRDKCEWDNKAKMIRTNTYIEEDNGIDDPYCKSGSFCIVRGGSWDRVARVSRSTSRGCYSPNNPDYRSYAVGFRLALVYQNNDTFRDS